MREYRPGDLTALDELVSRTIDVAYAGVYPPRAIAHMHEHHTADEIAADAEQGHTVVVEREGRIVATGTLIDGEITRVYVGPEWQGRGLGLAIMRGLEARARELGLEDVELYATIGSRTFYDRLGYVVTREGVADCGEGQVLKYYRMAKRLTPS